MFDLDPYLARIHLPLAPTPDPDGLAILQRAHRLAIPFENLDVALGRGIRIDSDSVFAKLVTARRGGYCFEQGRLFLDAMAALGFAARPLFARVWLGADGQVPPTTHTLALVTFGNARGHGRDWIADAGFGGSYAPPMPLADGEEAEAPDGARFRLARDPMFGWTLSRNGDAASTDGRVDARADDGWQRQYSFTTDPVYPSDLALSNHWVATAAESRFVRHRIVSIPLPHGFATLTDTLYRRRNANQAVEAVIDDPRVYRMRLGMIFGIDLDPQEIAGLKLFGAA
ncbi:arylamine N-acetyltransferase family protein [Sphingomonas bacterium]|uniref:arylamine N-acetyltransferase family protein n=1 Tax=Sphingomonas bacterium TaxID=1895847 RepID=UPI001577179D|nr:arylamine N-acetyltransferase [Sphingomonas bacterium]